MIDWEKSVKLNSCSIEWLKARFEKYPKSSLLISCKCDECGIERIVTKQAYRDLCYDCSMKSKKYKELRSKLTSEQWRKTEIRDKMTENIKKSRTPELCESQSIRMKEYWNDDNKDILFERMLDHWNDPKMRKKHTTSMDLFWDDPISHESASAAQQHQDYNAGEWTGFTPDERTYIKKESQCIKLNERVEGFHGNHITTGVIIYIPGYIHKSIYHRMLHDNMKEINMNEINNLAFRYLMGGDLLGTNL